MAKTKKLDLSYRDAQNIINRDWSHRLSHNEHTLLLWIVERTYAFNKVSEFIPIRHFLDGIVSANNNRVAGKIPFSRRTVFRTIDKLVKRKLLVITGAGNTHRRYEIPFNEIKEKGFFRHDYDEESNIECQKRTTSSSCDTPESATGGWCQPPPISCGTPESTTNDWCQSGTPECQSGSPECQSGTLPRARFINARATVIIKPGLPQKTREKKEMITNSPPKGAAPHALLQKVKEISEKTEAARKRKYDARTFEAMERLFMEQMAEHFPTAPRPPIAPTDRKKFRRAFLDIKNIDPAEYIKFAVSQWGYVLKHFFPLDWRKPWCPNVGFFSVHASKFTEAYYKHTEPNTNPILIHTDNVIAQEDPVKAKEYQIKKLEKRLATAEAKLKEKEAEAATYYNFSGRAKP